MEMCIKGVCSSPSKFSLNSKLVTTTLLDLDTDEVDCRFFQRFVGPLIKEGEKNGKS